MDDAQIQFPADFDIILDERVQGRGDRAFDGVFHRNDAVLGSAPLHLVEDIINGFQGEIFSRVAEIFYPGQMGKGCFRPQIGDLHIFLRESAGGDDLVEDAQQRLLGEGTVVFREQTFEDLALPQGIPFGLVILVLEFADFFGAEQPFFEKLQKLTVDGVDLVPDIGKGEVFFVFHHEIAGF